MTKIQNNEKLILKATNLRALDQDDKENDQSKTISGTAISFNSQSKDLGGFTEIVSPDAPILKFGTKIIRFCVIMIKIRIGVFL